MLTTILTALLPFLKEVISDVVKDWINTPAYRVKDISPSPLPEGAGSPLADADDLFAKYGGVLEKN